MDLRAWQRRTAEMDGMAYGDDYSYQEDEGYYDDATGATMSAADYDDLLFQRVLDKIRIARATGDPELQLTTDELEAYQARLLGVRAPAVRPEPLRARPVSAPIMNGVANNTIVNTSTSTGGSVSGSTRSKKSQRRPSIFAPRPKREKEKTSSTKHPQSNVSDATNQPPGFVVPGPGGQPMYAPINAYQGRMARDSPVRSSGSPSRPSSRSASLSGRQAPTPPRITPPRDVPGTFPSGSPQMYHREVTPPLRYRRDVTPPRQDRPPSSSSRHSTGDNIAPSQGRSRSSSVQQPTKLVPFPVTDYQHYSAEPYQYHTPVHSAPSQPSSSSPQYARRVGSGPADGNRMGMPRRVPVPVQRATASLSSPQSSHSDSTLGRQGSGLRGEVSDDDDDDDDDAQGGILVDVVPRADEKSPKVQTGKTSTKAESSGGRSKDSDKDKDHRRRRSGRTKKKS
ncbi:hypothetical protein BDV95DRAFT_483870 [Massariosphaeria phaeospora]|uniref:Uncharacterized protein n=1 Tax=Massariosphaeria phaeospora TaxID=100035 RepID=A0A7C8MGG5_9PLEO|nr:hypothetical protein BDV95DRAFT_483870 [Massariosphaeria phaeospora]